MSFRSFLLFSASIIFSVVILPRAADAATVLIIAGEGGPSGSLVQIAAETAKREQGGVLFSVHDGEGFLRAIRSFVRKNGPVTTLLYFGHGNEVGLYVNQEPGVNAALYANDPGLNFSSRADSFYALTPSIFAPDAEARFYGCNVARGYPDRMTFAEKFADHFRITVHAMTGPSEFSRDPLHTDSAPRELADLVTPPSSLYMVPSDTDHGFVTILPSRGGVGGYGDVYEGGSGSLAIAALAWRSGKFISFNVSEEFQPYRSVTYGEAQEFCRLVAPANAACALPGYGYAAGEKIRNLHALAMLTEAFGFRIPHPPGNHKAYVAFALREGGLLTEGFMLKRWYTREEMAELAWNFLRKYGEKNAQKLPPFFATAEP